MKKLKMPIYYVNDNALERNEHLVHKEGCDFLSFMVSKTHLGELDSIKTALLRAKEFYPTSRECEFCNKALPGNSFKNFILKPLQ